MNLETISSISQIIGTAAVMGRVVSVARAAMRTPQVPEPREPTWSMSIGRPSRAVFTYPFIKYNATSRLSSLHLIFDGVSK